MPKYSLMYLLDQIVKLLVVGVLMLTGSILLLVLAVLLLVKVLICSLLMTLIPSLPDVSTAFLRLRRLD